MPPYTEWCIYLSKKIQILEILYPAGIAAGDVCEVYETVLPRIQQLIDGVTIGYMPAEEVVTTIEPIDPDAETIAAWAERKWGEHPRAVMLGDAPYVPEPIKELVEPTIVHLVPTAEPKTNREPAHPGKPFIEDEKREQTDEWREQVYSNCTYFKKGDKFIIKGDSSRIDTNWEYICEFFALLADETVIRNLPGLNPKKRATLARFYDAHPNFSCHIEKVAGANNLIKDEEVLKKDDVRVNTATRSAYESGAALASDFDGLTAD